MKRNKIAVISMIMAAALAACTKDKAPSVQDRYSMMLTGMP